MQEILEESIPKDRLWVMLVPLLTEDTLEMWSVLASVMHVGYLKRWDDFFSFSSAH